MIKNSVLLSIFLAAYETGEVFFQRHTESGFVRYAEDIFITYHSVGVQNYLIILNCIHGSLGQWCKTCEGENSSRSGLNNANTFGYRRFGIIWNKWSCSRRIRTPVKHLNFLAGVLPELATTTPILIFSPSLTYTLRESSLKSEGVTSRGPIQAR